MPESEGNSLADLKKFFSSDAKPLTIVEFKAEWDELTDEEKSWFKEQDLES